MGHVWHNIIIFTIQLCWASWGIRNGQDILLPIILSIFIKPRETDSYEKTVGKGKFQYGAKGQELFNNKKFVKNFERIRLKTNPKHSIS